MWYRIGYGLKRARNRFPEGGMTLKVGLDVGSTTIKCVVLDDADQIVYSTYERHFSHILEKSEELLRRMAERYVPGGRALCAISGSAGMGMAESVHAKPFNVSFIANLIQMCIIRTVFSGFTGSPVYKH